tara:strand:- start:11167 stop:11652 length:486 start_codon:yes stop_codon:yes gene_type:complete
VKQLKTLTLSSVLLISVLVPSYACGNAARDYDNAVRSLIERTEKILTLSVARDLLNSACEQLQATEGDIDLAIQNLNTPKNSSELKVITNNLRKMANSLHEVSEDIENASTQNLNDAVAELTKIHSNLENTLTLLDASDAKAALEAAWENKGACGFLNKPI